MDELEVKLQGISDKLEGEAKNLVEGQITKLKEGLDAEIETKAKELAEKAVKALEDGKMQEMQKHLNELDVKLQSKTAKRTNERKSFEDALSEAIKEKQNEIEDFRNKKTKSFSIELKAVGDITTGNVNGTRYGQLFDANIIDRPSRKMHMDEVLPSGTIGPGNSFTFMREEGIGEGQIAAVAEGATKSQFDLDLKEETVQIETIAGWLRMTRKAMTNIPGMISFLQRRLPQKFRDKLDSYILYGTGTTPEMKGILATGNFKASTATVSLPLIEKIIHDVSTLEDTYERDANAIFLRPADYYSFFTNKASGSGEYDLPQGVTIVNGRLNFMGIPAYATTAITSPDYVVGDLEGAQLLTQESMRIEFFEQDGDNVRTNKVTVRIEGNFALPVFGDDYFIKGTTATS